MLIIWEVQLDAAWLVEQKIENCQGHPNLIEIYDRNNLILGLIVGR